MGCAVVRRIADPRRPGGGVRAGEGVDLLLIPVLSPSGLHPDVCGPRFYRSKFDAEATLQDFSARLRDEVDLETLTAELLAVVNRTLKPATTTLWLRQI
jgi:hypothetical protein